MWFAGRAPQFIQTSWFLTAAEWNDFGYAVTLGSGNDICFARNPFANFRCVTSATSFVLDGVSTGGTSRAAIFVNGVFDSFANFTADGARKFVTVTLPAGANKVVDVVASASNGGNGLYLRAIHGAVTVQQAVIPSARLIYYGNSISQGYFAVNETEGPVALLRLDYPGRVTSDGSGGRSLFGDIAATGSAALVAARLCAAANGTASNTFLLTIGTNDFWPGTETAANFAIQYGALVDAIHAALPSAAIFVVGPLNRSDEAMANTFGEVLADFTTAILGLASGRAWLHVSSGNGIINPATQTSDGLHPTAAGYVVLKGSYKATLAY